MKAFVRESINTILIVLGILSAGMGLKGFLLSSRFIDGGVTGISMLLSDVLEFPLAILILVINLPFIVLGYRQIGGKFAIKSALAIAGLSVCLAFINYPQVTSDKLLTAVFGGFFIGSGIGLAIRGGAVLDGTEVAALLGQQEQPSVESWRCHPHPKHLHLFSCRILSRYRIGSLFNSHLFRGIQNSRLFDSRDRGIHRRDYHL